MFFEIIKISFFEISSSSNIWVLRYCDFEKNQINATLVQTHYLKLVHHPKYSLHVFVKFVINCVLQQLFELLVFHVFFGIEFYIGLKRFVTISQVKMIGNITFRCYELPLRQFHTNQNSSKYISIALLGIQCFLCICLIHLVMECITCHKL